MNILIIDGNEKKASANYNEVGMQTQYDLYKSVIKNLLKEECNITIIHPTYNCDYLPLGLDLGSFHGILWTGSVLNIYDLDPSIERQIELAKELFKKKNKIFGSCWGLQVLATAAGGSVRKNPKGLEAVIAYDIKINNKGIKHPLYSNKPIKFDSFCWHYDEVDKLPENSSVLSSNEKSSIQSLVFSKAKSEVWAVQYHPEFDPKWISGLMNMRKSLLLEEDIFQDVKSFNEINSQLSNIEKNKYQKNSLKLSNSLIDKKIHTQELTNWLKHLKNNI